MPLLIAVLVGIAVWLLTRWSERIKGPEPLDVQVNLVSIWLIWISMFPGLGGLGLVAGWLVVTVPSWQEGPDAEVQPAPAWLWILGGGLMLLAVALVVLAFVLGRWLPKTDGPAYEGPAHVGIYAAAAIASIDVGLLVAAGAATASDYQAMPLLFVAVITVVMPFVMKDSW